MYVLENDIPIDFYHYIENQIKLPLIRIFEPIYGNHHKTERALFDGVHTRTIYQPKIASSAGGLSRYAVIRDTCMCCKNVLTKDDHGDLICRKCLPKKKLIYIERKLELNLAEKTYSDLWVQC